MSLAHGYAVPTTTSEDAAIGVAGRATRLWSMTIQVASLGVVRIFDGTDTTGTEVWGRTISGGNHHFTFPNGLFCASGAYLDIVSGTATVDFTYTQ